MAPPARLSPTLLLVAALPALTAALRTQQRQGSPVSPGQRCPARAAPRTCEDLGWPRAAQRRRVADGFTFNGPQGILEARLSELAPVVNVTAVVSTEVNFHGFAREATSVPFNKGFLHWSIPPKDFEPCRGEDGAIQEWCAASFAKNSVAEVLELADLDDEDWIVFSDADEIPDREAVRLLHECELPVGAGSPAGGDGALFVRLQSRAHYLYNLRCPAPTSEWTDSLRGPIAMKAKTMRTFGFVHFQSKGDKDCYTKGVYASCWKGPGWRTENMLLLECSAWHLSHFGGHASIMRATLDNAAAVPLLGSEQIRRCQTSEGRNGAFELLWEVKRDYPDVPHSIAEAPDDYSAFFDFT